MTDAIAWCDAGIRGKNPGGHAACAAYIFFDSDWKDPVSAAQDLGIDPANTNNTAEWEGLILAMTVALEHGVKRLTIRSDSKLIVEQVLGNWRVKEASLRPFRARALALAVRFESVKIDHVRRGHNKEADRLVTDLLDQLTGIRRGN